jgi:hypothetical protein
MSKKGPLLPPTIYSEPFLMVMTAFLENTIVSPRFLGTVNLAKMMPAMHA